jgi:hypothetical protein
LKLDKWPESFQQGFFNRKRIRWFLVYEVREKQNVYGSKFFLPFLFFISKAHYIRWKNLTLVFDENTSFSFYGPSKILKLAILRIFFKFLNFPKQKNQIFFVI